MQRARRRTLCGFVRTPATVSPSCGREFHRPVTPLRVPCAQNPEPRIRAAADADCGRQPRLGRERCRCVSGPGLDAGAPLFRRGCPSPPSGSGPPQGKKGRASLLSGGGEEPSFGKRPPPLLADARIAASPGAPLVPLAPRTPEAARGPGSPQRLRLNGGAGAQWLLRPRGWEAGARWRAELGSPIRQPERWCASIAGRRRRRRRARGAAQRSDAWVRPAPPGMLRPAARSGEGDARSGRVLSRGRSRRAPAGGGGGRRGRWGAIGAGGDAHCLWLGRAGGIPAAVLQTALDGGPAGGAELSTAAPGERAPGAGLRLPPPPPPRGPQRGSRGGDGLRQGRRRGCSARRRRCAPRLPCAAVPARRPRAPPPAAPCQMAPVSEGEGKDRRGVPPPAPAAWSAAGPAVPGRDRRFPENVGENPAFRAEWPGEVPGREETELCASSQGALPMPRAPFPHSALLVPKPCVQKTVGFFWGGASSLTKRSLRFRLPWEPGSHVGRSWACGLLSLPQRGDRRLAGGSLQTPASDQGSDFPLCVGPAWSRLLWQRDSRTRVHEPGATFHVRSDSPPPQRRQLSFQEDQRQPPGA